MQEIWKPVPQSPGYEVSNLGRVKSKKQVLKASPNDCGYLKVCLGRSKQAYVHRLVMLGFHGPPPEGYTVDHIDYDRKNNTLDNLRYLEENENRIRQQRYETEKFGGIVSVWLD